MKNLIAAPKKEKIVLCRLKNFIKNKIKSALKKTKKCENGTIGCVILKQSN